MTANLAYRSPGDLSKNTIGALVISPTRELATQIANEAIKCLTWHKLMEVRLLVGGENRRAQIGQFKRGRLDVVVATPGRLKDLMQDEQFGPEIRAAMSRTGTVSQPLIVPAAKLTVLVTAHSG